MERLILVNTGTDAWVVSLRAESTDFDVSLEPSQIATLHATAIKVGTEYQTLTSSAQAIRNGQPKNIVTEIEGAFLAAYIVLGALSAMQLFHFIKPWAR
jgi:hypothetical protein